MRARSTSPARERLLAVLALLAAGGGIVLAATQTFSSVAVDGLRAPVVVAGQQAAPALAPLGLVALAAAGATTIAGRVARLVVGVVVVLLGAAVVALALPPALDPAAGTAGALRTATGVTDAASLVRSTSGTAWPALAVAAGAVTVLLGLVVAVRGGRWTTGGRRFRTTPVASPSTDPVAEWDALTRGSDPTER